MGGVMMQDDAARGYGSIIGGALALVLAPLVILLALVIWACGKLRKNHTKKS